LRIAIAGPAFTFGQQPDLGDRVAEVLLLQHHVVHLVLERALNPLSHEARRGPCRQGSPSNPDGAAPKGSIVARLVVNPDQPREDPLGIVEILLGSVGGERRIVDIHLEPLELGLGYAPRFKPGLLGRQLLLGDLLLEPRV
jgi:hypothetical protein